MEGQGHFHPCGSRRSSLLIIITLLASAVVLLLLLLFSSNHCATPIAAISTAAACGDFSLPTAPMRPSISTGQIPAANLALGDVVASRNKRKEDEQPATVEEELAMARAAIRRAASNGNASSVHGEDVPFLSPTIYRNPAVFLRSYMEMEKRFKVYVYEEGEPPLVHEGPCKNIYTTEGRFIEEMEMFRRPENSAVRGMRTWNPARAHAFFLPFSITNMVRFIYRPSMPHDLTPLTRFVADYVGVVASKHPFWNRSAGADHFMLSCHDWGPHASRGDAALYKNSIRALCNANTSEGFDPRKDVSIPEINLFTGHFPEQLQVLSDHLPPLSARPFLAFFAGRVHGPIRPIILSHWQGRDPDLPIFEDVPAGGPDYYSYMLRSRFCLCPSGYEVASPRIVEAIYAECVPVVVSEDYVLPFSDVLRWEAFSVAVKVEEVPRLKEVLEGVPAAEVRRLREGVRAVKRHFVLNQPPKRFDVFHMMMHSVWLRRLNVKLL